MYIINHSCLAIALPPSCTVAQPPSSQLHSLPPTVAQPPSSRLRSLPPTVAHAQPLSSRLRSLPPTGQQEQAHNKWEQSGATEWSSYTVILYPNILKQINSLKMNECLAEINELKIRHHTLFWDSKINMYNSVTKQLMAMLCCLKFRNYLLSSCISKTQCSL